MAVNLGAVISEMVKTIKELGPNLSEKQIAGWRLNLGKPSFRKRK